MMFVPLITRLLQSKPAYVLTSVKGHMSQAITFPGSLEPKYSANKPLLRGQYKSLCNPLDRFNYNIFKMTLT